jgi:ferritin
MLKKDVEKALNQQIATEAHASFLYLSLASWCDMKGFDGAASFMYKHSDEERMHMLKLFHYINHSGGYALAPMIQQPRYEYGSLAEIFRTVYESEIKVTESVNELVELCTRERDFSTLNFIQWYVAEQHEEEVLFRSIIDKIDLVGDDGKGLFMLDQYLKTLNSQKDSAEADTAEA